MKSRVQIFSIAVPVTSAPADSLRLFLLVTAELSLLAGADVRWGWVLSVLVGVGGP